MLSPGNVAQNVRCMIVSPVFLRVLPSLGHAVVLTSREAPESSLRQEETRKGISLNDSCLFSFKEHFWKFHPTPHWLFLTARESRTCSLLNEHVSSHEIRLPSTSMNQRMSIGRAPFSLSQPHCYVIVLEAVNSHSHDLGRLCLIS